MMHGAKSWLSDPKHPNYEAAAKAIETVYGVRPDYSREGGSIPITPALEDATGMNVLLLPIGASDDMAHSQNEKYNIINLVNGIKVSPLSVVQRSALGFANGIPIPHLPAGIGVIPTRTRPDQGPQAFGMSLCPAYGRGAHGPRSILERIQMQMRNIESFVTARMHAYPVLRNEGERLVEFSSMSVIDVLQFS